MVDPDPGAPEQLPELTEPKLKDAQLVLNFKETIGICVFVVGVFSAAVWLIVDRSLDGLRDNVNQVHTDVREVRGALGSNVVERLNKESDLRDQISLIANTVTTTDKKIGDLAGRLDKISANLRDYQTELTAIKVSVGRIDERLSLRPPDPQ